LVSLRASDEHPVFVFMGVPPGGHFKCLGISSSVMGDAFARLIVHVVCGVYAGTFSVINFVSSQLKLFVIKQPTFPLSHTIVYRENTTIHMQQVQQYLLYFCIMLPRSSNISVGTKEVWEYCRCLFHCFFAILTVIFLQCQFRFCYRFCTEMLANVKSPQCIRWKLANFKPNFAAIVSTFHCYVKHRLREEEEEGNLCLAGYQV